MSNIVIGILEIIGSIAQVILLPINVIIITFLPALNTIFININNLFELMVEGALWSISILGVNPQLIAGLIMLYVFKFTVPIFIYFIKVALNWYQALWPTK